MRAYNKDAADVIIETLSTTTQGLRRICKDIGISTRTVYDWIVEDFEGFGQRYTRAKQIQADLAVEDAYDIADDTSKDTVLDEWGNPRENKEWTNRSRLRVDLRKWHASKLAPKVYGDRLDVTSGDEPVNSMSAEALSQIAAMIAANAKKGDE